MELREVVEMRERYLMKEIDINKIIIIIVVIIIIIIIILLLLLLLLFK